MNNKNKTNNIIIVLIISFFYYLIFFIGLNLFFKGQNKSLPDSILMLALYSTFVTTLIFAVKGDLLEKILSNRKVKFTIIVTPIIMILIGFISTLSNDYKKSSKDTTGEILNKGKQIYENADVKVNLTNIDKNLLYKSDGTKLLKKDNYGIIRQYKPVYTENMVECIYSLYTVKDGYILACNHNKNINYFTFTGNSNDPYYQINLNEKYLNNLDSNSLTKLDISDNSTYQKYKIDDGKYYTEQSYNKFSLYKQFNNDYYLLIKSWDIKKEIQKKYKIRDIEISRFYIKFISGEFKYYLAKCSVDDDYNIKIDYIEQ